MRLKLGGHALYMTLMIGHIGSMENGACVDHIEHGMRGYWFERAIDLQNNEDRSLQKMAYRREDEEKRTCFQKEDSRMKTWMKEEAMSWCDYGGKHGWISEQSGVWHVGVNVRVESCG
jgi:hypothetical protein